MPTRFDTTENALVTSRAHCWLVAFADVSSEYLDILHMSVQNFLLGSRAERVTLSIAVCQDFINTGIHLIYTSNSPHNSYNIGNSIINVKYIIIVEIIVYLYSGR